MEKKYPLCLLTFGSLLAFSLAAFGQGMGAGGVGSTGGSAGSIGSGGSGTSIGTGGVADDRVTNQGSVGEIGDRPITDNTLPTNREMSTDREPASKNRSKSKKRSDSRRSTTSDSVEKSLDMPSNNP